MEVEVDMRPRIEIKNGIYRAKIDRVEEKKVPTKDLTKPTADYAVIYFKLNDSKLPANAQGYELNVSYPGKVTPNSKLGAFLKKAGISFEGKKTLELDSLVGRDVELMVGSREWERNGVKGKAPDVKDIEFLNVKR